MTPTTVLTLAGSFSPVGPLYMPYELSGDVTNGNTVVPVIYNNIGLFEVNVLDGVTQLDAAINSTAGKKVVFGHSLGAIVIYRWLKDHGPTSSVSPSDLSFITIGNPANKYTGFLAAVSGAGLSSISDIIIGDNTPPADTPYAVTEVIRQYDGWADAPNVPTASGYPEALINAGIQLGIPINHVDYLDNHLIDPAVNVSFTEGNFTYTWCRTTLLDESLRDIIETAYDRPVQLTPPAPPPPSPDPPAVQITDALTAQLLQGDLISRAEAADKLAEKGAAVDPEWTITVCDWLWKPVGTVGGDLIDLQGTDPNNKLPVATMVCKGGSRFVDQFMGCRNTAVFILVETNGIRMPYYVVSHDYEFIEGVWTSTCHLKGIWDILNFYQIWPDWTSPIQAQLFSHAIFMWGLQTCIETMVSECALRIQSGINEFINNAVAPFAPQLDFRAWYGTLLQSNGNIAEMLKTPMYVVRTNPFTDTSPLFCKTVRMESCGSVISDITEPYGVACSMDLWLPGDPQPDEWALLDQPTYVFSTKDRSQITGPTKTALDSVIRTVVDLEGSLLGNTLDPILNPTGINDQSGLPIGVYIAPTIGVDFIKPWACLVAPDQGDKYTSLLTCKISDHTPQGWQHIIGGRSPKWLNDLMNATYAWIIDSISILIGFSGIPSNILDGFLNNAFLAFELMQHYQRRSDVGPYHPGIEVFHATASAPYNIETLFAFIDALWDSRGYTSATAVFRNGIPFALGRDVFKGALMSILYHHRTLVYTDYIENVMFHLSDTARDILVQIGDGRAEEAPLAKHQRFITGVFESINVLTLAPQS